MAVEVQGSSAGMKTVLVIRISMKLGECPLKVTAQHRPIDRDKNQETQSSEYHRKFSLR